MSQQHSNTTSNGLPIIYRDFEPTVSHIDSILRQLKEFAEEKNQQYNDRVFIYVTNFNGNKIDSSMTVDEAYQKLYGCTKAEMDKKRDNLDCSFEKSRKEKNKSSQADLILLY